MLLLHAGVGDRRLWDGQVDAFAERHLVVRPDLRGFGESPLPGCPFSHVEDVRALLDHLGLATAALVGNCTAAAWRSISRSPTPGGCTLSSSSRQRSPVSRARPSSTRSTRRRTRSSTPGRSASTTSPTSAGWVSGWRPPSPTPSESR
ncbi:MAG: alpha/beta fold hydrolase [Gaiellaceae bacterium]